MSGERVAAELLARLEEALERSPSIFGGLCLGAGGGEGVATEVVAHLEEALDGVSGGKCGRRHFYFKFASEAPVFMVFWRTFFYQDQMTNHLELQNRLDSSVVK